MTLREGLASWRLERSGASSRQIVGDRPLVPAQAIHLSHRGQAAGLESIEETDRVDRRGVLMPAAISRSSPYLENAFL